MMDEILMFIISALIGLGCFGAAGWVMLNPETLDVDKIFSIIAGSLLGVVFLGIAAWMLFHTHLRELWAPAAAAPESKPVSEKKKAPAPEEAGKSVS